MWEKKIKATKKDLKKWLRNPSKNPTQQRNEVVHSLETLQMGIEDLHITPEILNKEAALQSNTHHSFRWEEEYWRFKSRILWLKV